MAIRFRGLAGKPGDSTKKLSAKGPLPSADDTETPHLIVITDDEEFYIKLCQITVSCAWQMTRAASTEEAEALIRNRPVPLVIYERGSGDQSWQGGLRELAEMAANPCVLLASAVSDDNLLREVVRNRGYDVLPKFAPNESLIRCLNFAWSWGLAQRRERLQRLVLDR